MCKRTISEAPVPRKAAPTEARGKPAGFPGMVILIWKDAKDHAPSRSKKFFSPDYHGTMKETSTCFDCFANSPAFSRVPYPVEVLFRCLKVQNMPLEILNSSRRGRGRLNVWMFSRVGMPHIVVHRSTLHSSGNCSEVPLLCTFNRPLGGASRVKSQKLCAFRRV